MLPTIKNKQYANIQFRHLEDTAVLLNFNFLKLRLFRKV